MEKSITLPSGQTLEELEESVEHIASVCGELQDTVKALNRITQLMFTALTPHLEKPQKLEMVKRIDRFWQHDEPSRWPEGHIGHKLLRDWFHDTSDALLLHDPSNATAQAVVLPFQGDSGDPDGARETTVPPDR